MPRIILSLSDHSTSATPVQVPSVLCNKQDLQILAFVSSCLNMHTIYMILQLLAKVLKWRYVLINQA